MKLDNQNMNKVDKLIELIKNKFPKSEFRKIKETTISEFEKNQAQIPKELKEFYQKIGCGTIGDGVFSIHTLLEPDEIYDSETAKELRGKIIVGDNFSGDCYAYDTKNNWKFGYIDSSCEFITLDYNDFLEYLENLCLTDEYF